MIVGHTVREKAKLLNRVRRLRGQIEAIERALEEEAGCTRVMQLIVSVRGAANSLMAEIMEDHIRHHVADPASGGSRADATEELIEVVHSYLK
jgi:FrmR/RcnR family transcriptional regulator, repressor of frmRAB operon